MPQTPSKSIGAVAGTVGSLEEACHPPARDRRDRAYSRGRKRAQGSKRHPPEAFGGRFPEQCACARDVFVARSHGAGIIVERAEGIEPSSQPWRVALCH
jgi:hypothetical protein